MLQRAAFAAAVLAQHSMLASAAPAEKPHVFFLLVDDYGWAGAGWHNDIETGGQREVQTPHMDKLVATGIELNQHCEPAAVCCLLCCCSQPARVLLQPACPLSMQLLADVFKFCSPTRSSLQSGRNPIHVNVQNVNPTRANPADPVSGFSAIARNMTGMAVHMKAAGYATAAVGKCEQANPSDAA